VKPLTLEEVRRAVRGRWLARPESPPPVTSVVTDSREAVQGSLFVALRGERADGHDFVLEAFSRGAVAALVERPVGAVPEGVGLIAVEDAVAALGDLARYYRRGLSVTVVAVTGSNGKTTTKEMIAHLLGPSGEVVKAPKSYNNFVGVPLSIFSISPRTDFAVLELGTSAPGEIARLAAIAQPHIGLITNVGPTHLEGLGSVAGVARAKGELLDALPVDGTAVLNWDDDWCRRLAQRATTKVITFGLSPEADVFAAEVVRWEDGLRFLLNGRCEVHLPVPGIHNLLNALAAAAVCRRLGLSREQVAERFRGFRLPAMRFEEVDVGGVTVINDAYNANPVSMSAALAEFSRRPAEGRRLFVAGDMKELGPESARYHRELGLRAAACDLDGLFAVGEFADEVAAGAVAGGFPAEAVFTFATVEELVAGLAERVQPEDLVLLKGSRAVGLERVVEGLRELLLSRNKTKTG